MKLLRLAAFGGLAFAGWRLLRLPVPAFNAAFARDQGEAGNATQIRDAGPFAMRDRPDGNDGWSKIDEKSDQSFPASDPPGNY